MKKRILSIENWSNWKSWMVTDQQMRTKWSWNQSCKSGRAFRIGPGSGLSSSKCFGPISRLHTQVSYTIRSNDFFLSWSAFVLLNAVTCVSEVIVIFLQLILFANTALFFCSLLGLVSHTFSESESDEEISTPWHCVEKINHLRDSSHVLRSDGLQSGVSCLLGYLNSSFDGSSAIVDSFVIVCFYVEKHYIPKY